MTHKRNSGFSFVEVLVAIVLLSVSLVVLSQNQVRSLKLISRAKALETATQLAEIKITELTQIAELRGIQALKDKESGEFDQTLFEGFKWNYLVLPVPAPDFEKMMGTLGVPGEEEGGASNATMLAGPLQMIGKVWGQALRELRVEVTYGVVGSSSRSVELSTHLIAGDAMTQLQASLAGLTGGATSAP